MLKDDGIIFISIDDNELTNLKKVCDEIFGEHNIKVIAVKMSEASGLKMASVKKQGAVSSSKCNMRKMFMKVEGLRHEYFSRAPEVQGFSWSGV